MRENRVNGKHWDWETAIKLPDALSSRLWSLQTFVYTSWKDTYIKFERSTLPSPPV